VSKCTEGGGRERRTRSILIGCVGRIFGLTGTFSCKESEEELVWLSPGEGSTRAYHRIQCRVGAVDDPMSAVGESINRHEKKEEGNGQQDLPAEDRVLRIQMRLLGVCGRREQRMSH
jgi:hypothetical protein